MKESTVMTDLRKVKEELSLKHWNMTQEEMNDGFKEAREWFYERLGREKPRENLFNYTKLRENLFDNMTVEQVCEAVAEYKTKHNMETVS
jgi:hypothetical protein